MLVHRIRKSHFEKKQVTRAQDTRTRSSSVNTPKNGSNLNCPKCPKAFANSRLLTLHSKMEHWSEESASIFKYKCQECSFTYKSEKSLIRHSISSHGKPPSASERHESMDSSQNEEQDFPESDMINNFGMFHQCSLCSSKYSSKDGLTRHMKSLHSGRQLSTCVICKEQFGSDSSMYRHIKKFHPRDPYSGRPHTVSTMQEVAVKSENSFTSSRTRSYTENVSLNYSYNPANNSSAHQSSFRGAPILYECRFCDVRFMKINSLSQHEKNAHGSQ